MGYYYKSNNKFKSRQCVFMDRQKLVSKNLPIDYEDCFSKEVVGNISVDDIFNKMFCDFPAWVKTVLRLRDALVRPLGLKTGTSFADRVIERNNEEIVIGASDKHLSFWVSIYCDKPCADSTRLRVAEVSTLVKYHNFLGRVYFVAILFFHRLIVSSLFSRATQPK